MSEFQIVYRCYQCQKEFNPDEVSELEEFDEVGDWQNPCPECRRPLVWGIK
jgi:DNA-directed RNA polymerase subunit RPC12/RpoP